MNLFKKYSKQKWQKRMALNRMTTNGFFSCEDYRKHSIKIHVDKYTCRIFVTRKPRKTAIISKSFFISSRFSVKIFTTWNALYNSYQTCLISTIRIQNENLYESKFVSAVSKVLSLLLPQICNLSIQCINASNHSVSSTIGSLALHSSIYKNFLNLW